MNRRDLLILGGGTLLATGLPAWAQGPRAMHGKAFGSAWKLVADVDALDAAALREDIEAVVAAVDGAMSPFRAGSELSRFNRATTTGWQALSAETCAVVTEALRVAEATHDAFNPTLGPVTGRYGFGPIVEGASGTSQEISVREGGVGKARAELTLDLCGIAKGHALDRMADACMARGVTDFLLELGGEVFSRGRHPAGRTWRVGVEGPSGFANALSLDGAAVATSGISVNAFSHRGRRYAHIVDPETQRPADSALFSVTVAARTAMTADAFATALFAMGAARGPAFARESGVEALFVTDDGAMFATGGFETRFVA